VTQPTSEIVKDPTPPYKEPTPLEEGLVNGDQPATQSVDIKQKPPTPPLSPVYTRKFFPNPVPSEPYKPKIHDYTPNTVKLKRVDYFEEAPKMVRRQFDKDIEVKPLKFSSVQDNCIKKALFLGDQYIGGQTKSTDQSSKEATSSRLSRESVDVKLQVGESEPARNASITREKVNVNLTCDTKFKEGDKKNDFSLSEAANDAMINPVSASNDNLKDQHTKLNSKEREVKTHISQIRGASWRDSFSIEKDHARSKSKSMTPVLKEEHLVKPVDDKLPKQPKKKASTKIIDILTAKKIKDENSSPTTSPRLGRRKLSEYVSEKLRQSSKSRSNTPASPITKRRNGLSR